MRIDPQIPAPDAAATSSVSNQRSGAAANAAAGASGQPNDTVQLSAAQTVLSSLVSQLANVPDVRQQKVDALRAQIQSGQYQASNEQVANAIVDELVGPDSNG